MTKDIVLPKKLVIDEKTTTDSYAKFIAEPYERGYGQTVGNALRRILLSSLEGAAVSAVRIEGARHEYSTVTGLREDVINILLNLKKLRVKMFTDGPETVYLSSKKGGPITAAAIRETDSVKIINKDLVIANAEAGGKMEAEIEIIKGRGYVPAEEARGKMHWPAGFIPVDAMFSPIQKVHYEVENARVGQRTDYDRLILEIWTDGTIAPMEALHKSTMLLKKSVDIFLPAEELRGKEAGGESGARGQTDSAALSGEEQKINDILGQPVDMIELSSRASNCLKIGGIRTVGELIKKQEEELLGVKNFGKKSLDEIKERLKDIGLSLGMKV